MVKSRLIFQDSNGTVIEEVWSYSTQAEYSNRFRTAIGSGLSFVSSELIEATEFLPKPKGLAIIGTIPKATKKVTKTAAKKASKRKRAA